MSVMIEPHGGTSEDVPPDTVAVVGMACKFPGADSLEQFWHILETGQSMVGMPPSGRFPGLRHSRSTEKSIFFGNYLNDVTSFDNRFFKLSSREAASMDPQQRLLLEAAYQALESSGYFGPREQETDVGCYVGVCASDYNDNVAGHRPNAYSTLGTLRAFLTGRISHTFGFVGPSITYDTACSASAVAVDAACKAVLQGDCKMALAGGVSVFTSPHFFQNLSAASFLSPSGATKSFDARADGYCRGEGVGLVVLKQLSQAISDGDNILGTILATSVRQSSNVVPITVPYSLSQTALYQKVLGTAGITADEISYLESHGTGTPVGDVQEFESIKKTFGSDRRQQPLHFASVKGSIGHTEGASGVAGLIKVLLMMQKQRIPVQANYTKPNPKISLVPGQLVIPTETNDWGADVRLAMVNNYGAAGSMASMVVKEPPKEYTLQTHHSPMQRYPFLVSANSEKSLALYCQTLRQLISSSQMLRANGHLLADLAFNLSDTQNIALPTIFANTASSITELDQQLAQVVANPDSPPYDLSPEPKPVILVFGGQTAQCASISKDIYDSSSIFRRYLDRCQETLQSLGYSGIYPGVFTTEPIDDIVALQARQFAVQYASAQTWIACGLKVKCVLGHSFGQLVALSVSGVLSLADGLKLVCGRGALIRDKWGPEKGSMIALDADIEMTQRLMSVVQERHGYPEIEVACYNGPKSHVLVGSDAEIEAVAAAARESAVRCKVLTMTHGFHSRFCDAIIPGLKQVALRLTYSEPKIPIETCSEGESWPAAAAKLIADHTRTAVYFEDAVKRIEARNGACTWVEAGSKSSVISLTRRVFINSESDNHLYCPVNLVQNSAMGGLASTTTALWRHGNRVQFWPFHRLQRRDYRSLRLPPYQFEKKSHWLDFQQDTGPSSERREKQAVPQEKEPDPVLMSFNGFQDPSQRRAVFTIDPRSAEWQTLVNGHSVLSEPMCPAPLYMELVFQASKELSTRKEISCATFPRFDDLEMSKPLGASQNTIVTLTLNQSDSTPSKFEFVFQSQGRQSLDSGNKAVHATGSVEMVSPNGSRHIAAELDRLGKLIRSQKLEEIGVEHEGEAAQGPLIYKIFSRVVDYHDFYKGARRVASNASMAVATVNLPEQQPTAIQQMLLNPVAIDNFLQVPGFLSNCLGPCPREEIFVCTLIDRVQFSPDLEQLQPAVWDVFATSTAIGEKECTNDVFVRDKATGKLIFVAFGAIFSRVRISSLANVISRANKREVGSLPTTSDVGFSAAPRLDGSAVEAHGKAEAILPANGLQGKIGRTNLPTDNNGTNVSSTNTPTGVQPTPTESTTNEQPPALEFEIELQAILSRITDIPPHEFQGGVQMEDLGVDSLMATEIVSEISQIYDISISQDHLQELSTFSSLRDYLAARGGSYQLSTDSSAKATSFAQSTNKTPNEVVQAEETTHPDVNSQGTSKELVRRLASLLATHLECPATSFDRSTVLADRGLDSLLCIELMSDIERLFGVSVDLSPLTMDSIFGELADILVNAVTGVQDQGGTNSYSTLSSAPDDFEIIKSDFDSLANKYGFAGFYQSVHPSQTHLVLAYTVEAFADLGIDLNRLNTGDEIPKLNVIPRHHHLRDALFEVLRHGGVANYDGSQYVRSEKALDPISSRVLLETIVEKYPQHAKEHELLNLCGSQLGSVLRGEKDPLAVLFGSKTSRSLLEDVHSASPMYTVMSQLLTTFLEKTLSKSSPGSLGKFRIIEVGAGTGSTTKWIVKRLVQSGIPIEYTFTDYSSSFVAAGRRKFSKIDCMKYTTLDVEKEPPTDLQGQFDVVISTNCIHATSSLSNSLGNLNKLLQPNGFVSLVEFTKRFFWFDIVFGILEGWWLFNDGRPYVLTTPEHWGERMRTSGFTHVSWTGGSTRESEAVRIITGFKRAIVDSCHHLSIPQERTGGIETLVFQHTDRKLPLKADIHYPSPAQATAHNTWVAAILIHGGGHVMLSRKDIRPRQTQLLLDNGVLPVSIDYRLCPETTILEGPLVDVNDAYAWVLNTLPSLNLTHSSIKLVPGKVVVIGWSTGGTLAMSLAWTSVPRGLRPPEAILSFYCPTAYEDEFWQKPNIPDQSEAYMNDAYDVMDGVFAAPIASYNLDPKLMATGGWMTPKDARSRLILHMNWKGQTLPILFGGLSSAKAANSATPAGTSHLEQPRKEDVMKASPYAQIKRGAYKSPTHIVFGTSDDLIPWKQAQRTADALREAGVESGLTLVPEQPHLFDIYSDKDGKRWAAVLEGYNFLFKKLHKT